MGMVERSISERGHQDHEESPTKSAMDVVEGTSLRQVVEFLEEPAYLVSASGAVVLANASARRLHPRAPRWLADVPTSPCSATLDALARVRRIDLTGRELWLVIPKRGALDQEARDHREELLEGLPPSLSKVAELVLAGLSDREIADQTGLTYRTVRTYLSRLYRRVGVTSRAELLAMALGRYRRR